MNKTLGEPQVGNPDKTKAESIMNRRQALVPGHNAATSAQNAPIVLELNKAHYGKGCFGATLATSNSRIGIGAPDGSMNANSEIG